MSYGLSNNLPRLHNYLQAHAYFEGRAKPPRSKKYEINERPLASVTHAHYKIIKGENYYDIKLYSTIMARYYAPDAEGVERQLYMGHNSMTSRSFMWQVLFVSEVNETDSDTGRVVMPIYSRSSIEDKDGIPFSKTRKNEHVIDSGIAINQSSFFNNVQIATLGLAKEGYLVWQADHKEIKNNRYTDELDVVYDLAFKLTTDLGDFYLEIPPYNKNIRKLIAACSQ